MGRFIPRGTELPTGLEHERFRLRPITIHDTVRDYDAVMSSREHLWSLFGEAWGWSAASLALEQDLIGVAYPGRVEPWDEYDALPDAGA